MSFVRTLLLALVALGLGAWLWFVEAPKMEQEAKANLLLDIEPAEIEKLRLAYPDGTAISAVRGDDGKWKLTEPVSYPADSSVIDNFLTTVKETKIERRMAKDEAGALASYGLEGPTGSQARLELTAKGGKALPAVVLGTTTPVGYEAFARKEGSDEVLLIPMLLQSSAKKTPTEVRAKTMFEGDSAGIVKVVIEKPGETIELERTGDRWTMKSPIADDADAESVRSMLDSIATIDAVDFFDGERADRAAFGLQGPEATKFTATREDGSRVEFTLGKVATDQPAGIYFERLSDGQVVKAPDWVPAKFAPPANDLRDKKLVSCKADEILGLSYEVLGESFTLTRKGAGQAWSIEPGVPNQKVNQRIVDNAVNSLVLARADAVVGDAANDAELKQYGLDNPTAKLRVTGANGTCADLIGAVAAAEPPPADPAAPKRPPAKKYHLKETGRKAVLRASEHEYSRLAMKRSAFVESVAPAGDAAAPQPAAPKPDAGKPATNPESLGTIVEPKAEPAKH